VKKGKNSTHTRQPFPHPLLFTIHRSLFTENKKGACSCQQSLSRFLFPACAVADASSHGLQNRYRLKTSHRRETKRRKPPN